MFKYIIKADDDKAIPVKSDKHFIDFEKYINTQLILDRNGDQVLIINYKEYKNPKVMTKDDYCEYLPVII